MCPTPTPLHSSRRVAYTLSLSVVLMSRFFLVLALAVAWLSSPSSVASESIVSDSVGNGVFLPTTGGNATNTISVMDAEVTTSPYTFYVYLNNGIGPGVISASEHESFYIPTRWFADATMMNASYTPFGSSTPQHCPGHDCMRNSSMPNTATGIYAFTFDIPVKGYFAGNITYRNWGSNPLTVQEIITITIFNPMPAVGDAPTPPTIVGDPQFVGLRGQSYQVHGVDGAVYNLISEQNTQVNSRFVFLNDGECPMIGNKSDSNCWSHPGSYLGEVSFQQLVDGELHTALIAAGSARAGFELVEVDGELLAVGDEVEYGSFRLLVQSTHRIHVHTDHFEFDLTNSDMFINQALRAKVPLQQLQSHGLIGQTHSSRTYATSIKYIQGEVDDYVILDDDIFGTQFLYNRFQL